MIKFANELGIQLPSLRVGNKRSPLCHEVEGTTVRHGHRGAMARLASFRGKNKSDSTCEHYRPDLRRSLGKSNLRGITAPFDLGAQVASASQRTSQPEPL